MRKPFWVRVVTAAAFASLPAVLALSFLEISDDSDLLTDPEPMDTSSGFGLAWKWHESDLKCEYFVSCTFLEVQDSSRCPDQIFIPMFVSDERHHRVTWSDLILDSPRTSDVALIEIGVNIEDFTYFNVGDITCTIGAPTLEIQT